MKNIVKKYIDYLKTDLSKALLYTYGVCICAALILNMTAGVINFALKATGVYSEKHLTVNDFELVGAEYVDNMTIINATNDTQMIYTGNVRRLAVKCEFSRTPGEFVCFYSNSRDYGFGTHKMKYAKMYGDYYIFDFPYGTKQVRMDTGVEPSITVSFEEIALNRFGLHEMFGFSTAELFSLLIIPRVIYFIADTALKVFALIKKK